MAEKTERPERHSKSRNETREILFGQIVTSATDDFCHRDEKQLSEEKLAGLSASLIQEGLATPPTVCETDATVNLNREVLPALKLVGGRRRFEAIKAAIANHSDPSRIHDGMKVTVVVMVPGVDQTEEEFQKDVLVRSITENEQRLSHTALERLHITKKLEAASVPAPRAAAALGISMSQYRRDRLVATWPWLFAAVEREEIGASDAAKLAEVAKDKKCESVFRSGFEAWVRKQSLVLEDERAEQKKLGRELKGSANTIRKYLDGSIVKGWLNSLKEQQPFSDDGGDFNFGVVIDPAKKTVVVSAVNQPIDKLKSSHVAMMIAEMQAGARKLVPVMRRLQQLERATDVTDADIDAELARVAEELRLAAEAKAAMEAGRDPADPIDSDEREPVDLVDELDEVLREDSDDDQLSK